MPYWGVPHGFQGLSTLANDTPGSIRYSEYVASDGTNTHEPQILIRLFNDTGGALTVGRVYMMVYDGDEEKNPKVVACAAVTANCHVVVATEATADQAWGWFVIHGYVDAAVEGTTDVAKDDFLKIVAATSAFAFIKDGTTKTTDSFAMATAAQAADSVVNTKVYLIGEIADID